MISLRQLPSLLLLIVIPVQGGELGPPPRGFTGPETVIHEVHQAAALVVDTQDRADVMRFFQTVYRASEGAATGWNGDVSNCVAGVNSQEYRAATLLRINYYRAMAGLPADITLDETLNVKCQEAALMMAAQGSLSHQPPATWKCYSAAGAEAAGHANLYLGTEGPKAIDGYIDDVGGANYFVGHRRWILYPPQKIMGAGSIPKTDRNFWSANALWVVGGSGARPARPAWVAWPPPGFVPYQVLPGDSGRWSFSYPQAGFAGATVTIVCRGTNVAVTVESQANNIGYADNTLVWVPQGIAAVPPATDLTCEVTLSNVVIGGQPQTFAYRVTIIDPEPIAMSVRSRGAGQVEILWPTNPPNYYLWANQTLGIRGGWMMAYPWPTLAGTNYSVIQNTAGAAKFYLLRK